MPVDVMTELPAAAWDAAEFAADEPVDAVLVVLGVVDVVVVAGVLDEIAELIRSVFPSGCTNYRQSRSGLES